MAFEGRSETSLLDVITGSQTPVGLPDLVRNATDGAFETAAGDAMLVGVAAAAIGLVLALTLLGRTGRSPGAAPGPSAPRG